MTTWFLTRPRVWQRVVALVVCGLVVISSPLPLLAAPGASNDDSLTLTADRVEYNSQTRRVRADGHVQATGRGAVITADHLEGDLEAQEVTASGNVTLSQDDKTVTGSLLRYNLLTRTGRFEQAAGQLGVWHVSAEAIDVSPQQDVATGASITSCDPDHPLYKITAKKIVIVPNESFTAYDASLWVAGTRVVTLPSYTATVGGRSGPSVGFNTLDGVYLEYANSFLLGDWRDEYRVRLATTTVLSAENTLSRRFGDHVWTVHLGRNQVKDTNGTLINLDRYSLDLLYDRARIPGWPIEVVFEAHAGSYGELAKGVATARADAIVTFGSDTFVLSPGLFFSASGRIHGDAYGTGQLRSVIEGSAALFGTLGPRASASLSYGVVAVNGSTPFSFDSYGPSSSASLNYSYAFDGFVQSAGASLSYDFVGMQPTLGVNMAMSINPNTAFNIAAYYNLATRQLTEIDYALNVRCDCVTVGLVYQTFPQSPASNTLMITVELNAFPGRNVVYSGPGIGF